MSRSVDLFIQTDLPVDEVAARLGRLTDLEVTWSAAGGWLVRDGDVEASLGTHHYMDEGELSLSHYPYALSGRVSDSGRISDAPVAALLRRIAEKVQREADLRALLVIDLQYRDQPRVAPPDSPSEPAGSNHDTSAEADLEVADGSPPSEDDDVVEASASVGSAGSTPDSAPAASAREPSSTAPGGDDSTAAPAEIAWSDRR